MTEIRHASTGIALRRTENIRDSDWLAMRSAFWDDESEAEHLASLEKFTRAYSPYFAIIASTPDGNPVGFVEISVRRDYVNGCQYSPVLYLEGLFVRPELRKRGIARELCRAAENWGREQKIREFASDSDIRNEVSIRAHIGLGFEEMERVVCFRKLLTPADGSDSQ